MYRITIVRANGELVLRAMVEAETVERAAHVGYARYMRCPESFVNLMHMGLAKFRNLVSGVSVEVEPV